MAVCPLRPATDRRLGRPLPYQLANQPRTPPSAHCCVLLSDLCGIIFRFQKLFPTKGQMIHVLLTRTPLYSGDCSPFLVRLACVKRAASVDSEPGSNSHLILFVSNRFRPIPWPFHDSYVTLTTSPHDESQASMTRATTELLETSQLLLKVLTKYYFCVQPDCQRSA